MSQCLSLGFLSALILYMAKRFIDTGIWMQNKWFRILKPELKLLWFYLISNCDPVGVWEEDIELASFIIGYDFKIEDLNNFSDRIKKFSDKKYWIVDFCDFQYGLLKDTELNRPHQSYILLLKKHSLYKDYLKTIQRDKEKEKDKEKDKDKETEKEKEFLDLFNEITKRNFRILSNTVKGHLNARLKEGFTMNDFEMAITNCMRDEFHQNNPQHLTPEFITRADKLQKYLNIKTTFDQVKNQKVS